MEDEFERFQQNRQEMASAINRDELNRVSPPIDVNNDVNYNSDSRIYQHQQKNSGMYPACANCLKPIVERGNKLMDVREPCTCAVRN